MLMVIFGAGASYDSFPSAPAPPRAAFQDYEQRPPLASQLFAQRDFFRDVARRYPKCLPLIAELEPRTKAGTSVEQFLEEYQAHADEEGRSQLWSIQYYLRDVIQKCQSDWNLLTRGVSNYSSLFNQARRSGSVCFVTFNYDTLLEEALTPFDIDFPKLGSYVNNPSCTLVKPHGSTDWTYWIRKGSTSVPQDDPTPQQLIRAAPSIAPDAIITKAGDTPVERRVQIYFQLPALAIPVVSKSQFVCPESHLTALRALLPRVTHIVAIGWRAAESHFLAMLSEHLTKPVAVTSVCGDGPESQEILSRIESSGVKGRFSAMPDTFTEFVRNHGIETFLKVSAT